MAKLYIVSTPIGNLADISYRAVEILGAVDRVLAEDTRRTAILFRHYAIQTPMYSAYAHNEQARTRQLTEWLDAGENVALVSDAGTPLISDPGARIVHTALAGGHDVIPVPGASSLLSALVASGLATDRFCFFGFPPRSGKERRQLLARIARLEETVLLFEAPGRVGRLLSDLAQSCGGERRAVVARELTKVHETFVRGTLDELCAYYRDNPPRGEVVVLVAAAELDAAEEEKPNAGERAAQLLQSGASARDVARQLSEELGIPRNEAYQITQALRRPENEGKSV